MLIAFIKRHRARILIGLVILGFFAVHAARWQEWRFLVLLESIAYDARLILTMPEGIDDRIVIIDIDEKSLAAQGQWPWKRDKLAKMIDQLFDRYHILVVGFDVVFAEPQESTGLRVLDDLTDSDIGKDPRFVAHAAKLRPLLDHDRIFADSLAGRNVILGYFFAGREESGEVPKVGKLPDPVLNKNDLGRRTVDFYGAEGYGANLPQLQEQALGAGNFVTQPDIDGVVRRVPMLYEFEDNYYETLSLAVARVALGGLPVRPGFPSAAVAGSDYSGMEWLSIGNRRIPVDLRVRALIPYRGRQGSFPYISATDVISGAVEPSLLAGKIALFGTTAKGLLDLRATPVQPDYPGVEAHANLVAGILDNTIMENPAYTLGAEFILLVFSGLIMAVLLPALSPLWAVLTTVALLAGIIGVNLWIWQVAHFVFPLAAVVASVLTLFLFNMSWGFFVESLGKRQLAGRFGQYVPPELVDEMSEDPNAFTMDTVNKELTVLFSDVRSFTTISEGLSPKELSELMNAFLTPMTQLIYSSRGTIDKYMGDAIMAFWGAPLHDADHARHALETGMDMVRRVAGLRSEFEARGWPPIKIGVGLNTGDMNVGNMGSEFRVAYTVMGDAVNLGSRLEGLTKVYGVDIMVNESTAEAVPDYLYRELDRVRVKGKEKPVTIYEPLGPKDSVEKSSKDELGFYRDALKLYRSQNWDMAEIQFLNLQQQNPERALYALYIDRIGHFRREPPGDSWDGVFTHETK